MSNSIKGSCICRAVTFQFHGPEMVFQYCHCSRCRKFTGSAHSAAILIDPKQFEWLSGEDQLGRFEHPEAKHFATSFCKQCGSSLPWLAKTGRAVVIPAGSLDDDPGIRPSQNIFWDSRAAWREAVETLPQHAELPRKD